MKRGQSDRLWDGLCAESAPGQPRLARRARRSAGARDTRHGGPHLAAARLWLAVALSVPWAAAAAQNRAPERYRDWARPAFPAEEFVGRRERLIAALREQGGGVMLVPSASGYTDGETFRQTDGFLYFTGLELPQSVLWVDADAGRVILFAPATDPRWQNPGRPNDFPGRMLGADPEVAKLGGLDTVASIDDFPSELDRAAGAGRRLWVDRGSDERPGRPALVPTDGWAAELELDLALAQRFPALTVQDAHAVVARLRMIKSPREIEAMRRVVAITAAAMLEAATAIRPGVTERALLGRFEAACRDRGAQRFPFTPIVKSGPNALWPWRILASHYDRRDRALEAGDVVVFDVGCELDGYVSDVGRTFPVGGAFRAEHRSALTMVTAVSDAILAAIRPGVTLLELRRVAEAAIPPAERPYMTTPSFFGHHIGLASGDPALLEAPLEPGMVFTVEPWYYNHDRGIAVFVEDDVLVTPTGVEILSRALPRTPAALAAAARR